MSNEKTPNSNQGQDAGPEAGEDTQESNSAAINALVNTAVTSQLKRAISPKAIAPLVEQVMKPALEGLISQLRSELAQQQASEPVAKKSDEAKPDPQVAALQQQVQELIEQKEAERKKARKLEKKQRNAATFSRVSDLLSENKVRPELVEPLAKVLVKADKRVVHEDGNMLFRVKVSPGKGQPETEQLLPLEHGIQHYLKSKKAEVYLLPGGAGSVQTPKPKKGMATNGVGQLPKYDSPAIDDAERARRAVEMMTVLGCSLPGMPS